MSKEISVREWQLMFANGEFDSHDTACQCAAGWYDWFCKSSSLANKTKRLGRLVKQVKDGGKVNLDTMYVWFKNNCPCVGPLYDDFRFADRETGNVQFTIACDDQRAEHKYEVWGRHNDFNGPITGFDSAKELIAWLNKPWQEGE